MTRRFSNDLPDFKDQVRPYHPNQGKSKPDPDAQRLPPPPQSGDDAALSPSMERNKVSAQNRTLVALAPAVPVSSVRTVVHTGERILAHPDGSKTITTTTTYSDGTTSTRVERVDPPMPPSPLPEQKNENRTPWKIYGAIVVLTIVVSAGLIIGLVFGLGGSSSQQPDSTAQTIDSSTIVDATSSPVSSTPPPSSSPTQDPGNDKCTICYRDLPPANPNLKYFPGGVKCGNFYNDLGYRLDATSDECLGIQSQAFWTCGCPELPPPRSNPICSLCPHGGEPTNRDTIVDYGNFTVDTYRRITCEAQATRLTFASPKIGWIPYESCEGFQQGFSEVCGCPEARNGGNCTVCYEGLEPANPDLEYFPNSGLRCGDLTWVGLEEDDDECLGRQAQAFWTCGCPALPPVRPNPICSLCPGGSFPPNLDTIVDYGDFTVETFRRITCEAQAVRLSYEDPGFNWIPYMSCEGFQEGFGDACGCPS